MSTVHRPIGQSASGRVVAVIAVALLLASALPIATTEEVGGEAAPFDISDKALSRFDFGTRSSPLGAGYTRVQGSLLYSRGAGYGWEAAHEDFQNLRPPPEISPHVLQRSWVIERYRTDVTVDGVRDADPMTFSVDLPDGDYRVRVLVGDLFYPRYSMNVSAEGEQVAAELAAFHMVHRSVYMRDGRGNDANYGMPLPYWFSVTVADGTLDVTFWGDDALFWQRMDAENRTTPPHSYLSEMSTGAIKTTGSDPPYRFIGGPHSYNSVLGLEVYPPLDSLVTVDAGGLVLDASVRNETVMAMVDRYNDARTQLEFNALAEDVQELLVDTGTGELTDLKALEELLGHLEGNLAADLDPSDLEFRVEGLRDLLDMAPRDQSLAELLNQTERYRDALDLIFGRVKTGRNHFFENSKAISILWTFQEGDALHASASMWRARALYMLDPHRWTSASGTAADVMDDLRPLDPDNPYIRMYRDTTPTSGVQWDNGQRVVSTTGDVDSWSMADPNGGFEDAPQWASWLHEELYWLYDVTDWWVVERQQADGALGGGWSDDVEFIGLFGFDALISQGADELSLQGARRFVDGMLASGGVDLERGYSTALADAEHTAEWTGDSLPMMIAVDYGNPKWVEFAMKTGVLMRDLWMGTTDLGHLHFRSNYLSATRLGGADTREDAYINYRAALPARWVWWYNQDPEVQRLFVDWATAWVEDAMRTDDGKPRGVFPASIGFEGDELGGHDSPNWYTARHPAGTVNYDWADQMYTGYLEELVLLAYEATGNASLLEPFELEAQLAQAYKDDPVPDPTPGSAAWAGSVLGQGAIDRWSGIEAQYGLGGGGGGGGGGGAGEPNGYTPEDVVGMTRMGRRYIQHCLPLMTTEASATDRVAFVGIINPFMIYTGGGIGGALLSPKFTYTGLGRDFAACVQDARGDGASILMYGFYEGSRGAGIVPWELEEGGRYELVVGNDVDGDGEVDVEDLRTTFTWQTRGQVVWMKLNGGSEKLVVIRQLEAGTGASALLPDMALDRDGTWVNGSSGALDVLVHNIGAKGTGRFMVQVLDPEDDDAFLGSAIVDELPPPSGMRPSVLTVPVHLQRLPSGENVTVILWPHSENLTEITTLNNLQTFSLDTSGLRANGPPVYVGPRPHMIQVEEDANLTEPLALLELDGLFEDPDGDELRFELGYDNASGSPSLRLENGTVWLVELPPDWDLNATFNVTALDAGWDGVPGNDDDHGATSPGEWLLEVTPVNDPPAFVGPPDGGTLLEDEDADLGEGLNLLNLVTLFEDVEGDELVYGMEVLEGEENVTFEVVDGVLVWRAVEADWNGNVTFVMTARDPGEDGVAGNGDDGLATSPEYTLAVRPVNDPPHVVAQPEDVEVVFGTPTTLDLSGVFADVDGDTLFVELNPLQPLIETPLDVERMSEDLTEPVFLLTSKDRWFSGQVRLVFICYDRDPRSMETPGTAHVGVNVTVLPWTPANRAPWAPNVTGPEGLRGRAGEELAFSIEDPSDPDGDSLEVRWDFGDGNLTEWSNESTGAVHAYAEAGSYSVTVSVRDGRGGTNSTTVTMDIELAGDGDGRDEDGHGDWTAYAVVAVVVAVVAVVAAYVLSGRRGGT